MNSTINKTSNRVYYITVLRALAACIIVNSHYTGIYPNDIIANGGLLGNILFFAISGYCLFSVKQPFVKWYVKRVIRCYLPVWIITIVYLLVGFYSYSDQTFIWWFIYPTYTQFVSQIVILYIPFYFIASTKLKNYIPQIALGTFTVYLLVYIFAFDKGSYGIDRVDKPMILFLYFESMLFGAWVKSKDKKFLDKRNKVLPVITLGLTVLYFCSKFVFSKIESISYLQVINQIIIYALLCVLFLLFASLESKLERLPKVIKSIIDFLSERTLEIYVVQFPLIEIARGIGLFPLNWFAATTMILVAATILHFICQKIQGVIHV